MFFLITFCCRSLAFSVALFIPAIIAFVIVFDFLVALHALSFFSSLVMGLVGLVDAHVRIQVTNGKIPSCHVILHRSLPSQPSPPIYITISPLISIHPPEIFLYPFELFRLSSSFV